MTLLLGHRGAPRVAPENTIAAFAEAVRQGADGVELDVQLSADGVPVVIHDDTLERTTDGRGAVNTRPWSELREVRSSGEPLASLGDALEWATRHDARLNVEIKAAGAAAATVAALRDADALQGTIISSFHAAVVAEVGQLAPDSRRYLLSETWDAEVLDTARRTGAGGICLHVDAATPSALHELRSESLPVVVWTVNDLERARSLLAEGVEAIITDLPGEIASLARGLPPRS
jgi:glycerophosphoryl diester phosphodiesterase